VKTIGDAVMAMWNAPVPARDHADLAARAALGMHGALRTLNAAWAASGYPEVRMRIGIHTGAATVGNFGTRARTEFDARGDAVNLAARLEALNKEYGTAILVSDELRRAAGDTLVTREVDRVRVAGRRQPVTVHEVLGLRGDDRDGELARTAGAFAAVRTAYVARAWNEAVRHLEEIAARSPDDGVARVYLERCRRFVRSPPPSDWDGVHTIPGR
jgi:adenylate cyclase